jgi:hypothetical protein
MKFVEMTGATLAKMLSPDEMQVSDLKAGGVKDDTIVRINEQGDIEIRRKHGWDVIGGLLGEYQVRVKKVTGLDWA